MANRRRDQNFFIYAPDKHGKYKGTRLLGVNNCRANRSDTELSLQDLLDFLKEKEILPDQVFLSDGFITRTKKNNSLH
jgi:hypothetical protein